MKSTSPLNAATRREGGVYDDILIPGLENQVNHLVHLGNSEGRTDSGTRMNSI